MTRADQAGLLALLEQIAERLETAPARAEQLAIANNERHPNESRYPYQTGALEAFTSNAAIELRHAIYLASKRKAA